MVETISSLSVCCWSTSVRIMEENQTEYRNVSRGIGGKEDARWAIGQNIMLAGIS